MVGLVASLLAGVTVDFVTAESQPAPMRDPARPASFAELAQLREARTSFEGTVTPRKQSLRERTTDPAQLELQALAERLEKRVRLVELYTSIEEILRLEQVPGAGIALIEGDQIAWVGGVGVADRATGQPVTADTLFRVGSITKPLIALAYMRLVEQGRVALGTRVGELAPELQIANPWETERPLTIAHLLEHTSGFDEMHPNETFGPLAIESMSLADVLARNPASRVSRWPPGTRFSYSNPGYTVAAYLLEKITGRPLEDVLRREVLEPLGMTGAALRWTPEVDARLARGYHVDPAPQPYWPMYHWAAGNLMASPRDLAALVQLGLARGKVRGEALVSPDSMARIERSETAWLDAGDARYGLGNWGDTSERAVIRGHGGGLPGYLTSYGYLPGHDVGYVVMINATHSGKALGEIRHLLVEHLLAGAVVPPPPRASVPEAELRRWVGSYRLAASRNQVLAFRDRLNAGVEISVDNGRMYACQPARRNSHIELVPMGGDRFRVPGASGSHVAFGRDLHGQRALVAGNAYFAEESPSQALAFTVLPLYCTMILTVGLTWPLLWWLGRRRPAGIGWVLCTSATFAALPTVFSEAFQATALGVPSLYPLGLFFLTFAFAIASLGCALHTLAHLFERATLASKLARVAFAASACCATGYLTAHGIIGIRIWSY